VDLVDTAGLRDSECPIEREGMRRSRTSMKESQITLIMIDLSQSSRTEEEGKIIIHPHSEELKMIVEEKGKAVVIINKIDTLPL
jgi:tRNA modification GTPase